MYVLKSNHESLKTAKKSIYRSKCILWYIELNGNFEVKIGPIKVERTFHQFFTSREIWKEKFKIIKTT